MMVRVFIPVEGEDHDFEGTEREFPVMPRVGDTIRFFDDNDVIVDKVGFIENGSAPFVACVWTHHDREEPSVYEKRGLLSL